MLPCLKFYLYFSSKPPHDDKNGQWLILTSNRKSYNTSKVQKKNTNSKMVIKSFQTAYPPENTLFQQKTESYAGGAQVYIHGLPSGALCIDSMSPIIVSNTPLTE